MVIVSVCMTVVIVTKFIELGLECSATQFWSVGLEARDHDLIFSWLEVNLGEVEGREKKGDRK